MKEEYQAIAQAGFLLQIDSPDLAMGKVSQFPDKTLEEFRKIIALRVEALNYALAGIPPEQIRHHVCWGNMEGPHHKDVELRDIIDILLKVRAEAIYLEGANPRHGHEWKVFRDVELPDGMVLIAGVIDTKTNFVEHPGVGSEPDHELCQCGWPRERHCGHGLRLWHQRRSRPGRSINSMGKAQGNGRRCPAGQRSAMGLEEVECNSRLQGKSDASQRP